jgi:hypothetical protein
MLVFAVMVHMLKYAPMGFSLHGLARAICQGYIAGMHAAMESGG